jgi:hypothetical protein
MTCRPNDHRWRPVRGGRREVCQECGTSFPCKTACEHVDCCEATGSPLPDWVAATSPCSAES